MQQRCGIEVDQSALDDQRNGSAVGDSIDADLGTFMIVAIVAIIIRQPERALEWGKQYEVNAWAQFKFPTAVTDSLILFRDELKWMAEQNGEQFALLNDDHGFAAP